MLKFFRHKNVAKIVLWGILILILPAFVLWGTGNLGRSKDNGPTYVGMINGKKVSFEDFGSSLAGVRCHLVLNYFDQPKVMDSIFKDLPFIGRLAWDRIIMLRESARHNFKANDKDVVNYLRSHPLFIRNGKFDEGIYGYVLRNNIGLDARTFEEIVRENLTISKFSQSITRDIKLNDNEILEAYRKKHEKYKVSYVIFATDGFLDKSKIGDVEAKDYYEKHKKEFTVPAKEGEDKTASRILRFEDIGESLVLTLSEERAMAAANEEAEKIYKAMVDLEDKNKLSFEGACKRLKIETRETPFFSVTDYLEGIGEGAGLVDRAISMKVGGLSGPVKVRKGAVIFKLLDIQKIDEEKFKKEKEDYEKAALAKRKEAALEIWLRKTEENAKLNIELNEYTKYYR